jgi:hypothetical protein
MVSGAVAVLVGTAVDDANGRVLSVEFLSAPVQLLAARHANTAADIAATGLACLRITHAL